MNILDENIMDSQRRQLKSWRILVRQIGYEVGRKGMKDREITSLLHQMNLPTFFTRDVDFYAPELCHAGYCLVYLGVRKEEVATFVRRFLRQKAFRTKASRMGKVIRVFHVGIAVWQLHVGHEAFCDWD